MNEPTKNGAPRPTAERRLHPFEVFGDYAPHAGARIVIRVNSSSKSRMAAISRRAGASALLDPAFAQGHLRAGLSLLQSDSVCFAWANAEGAVLLLREGVGPVAPIENELVSAFTARLSLLLGTELVAVGAIYELPDLTVVRRAFGAMVEDVEEATPKRSSLWLGAQLAGRGQPFHPSMVESLEEQSGLLQSNGIDMDALPGWWWRGMAGIRRPDGSLDVVEDIPSGEAFADLLAD